MGLSALDCERCGRWDSDGGYPGKHSSTTRNIEMPDGKTWGRLCDKCYKELKRKGGKPFHFKHRAAVKVYGEGNRNRGDF